LSFLHLHIGLKLQLVMIGVIPEGKKGLIDFQVGVRESAQSWRKLLIELNPL
jgi:transposase-like protein